jgi:hypothetical protein
MTDSWNDKIDKFNSYWQEVDHADEYILDEICEWIEQNVQPEDIYNEDQLRLALRKFEDK